MPDEKKSAAILEAISCILMVCGAGIAWGPGGAAFSMGLWLMMVAIGPESTEPPTQKDT